MVGVIDGFRWALLGGNTPMHWPGFLVSISVTVVMLICGLGYFRSAEKKFADVI
jgi:lipopolysaccharide transport system permease protein